MARAQHLAKEYLAPGMAEALASVTSAVAANVELRGIQARGEPDALGAFYLRITGLCTGREPRATADRFRQMLEANLKQFIAREGVTTRFERLEDVTPSSPELPDPQKPQAAFTAIASTNWDGLEAPERSEKR